MGPDARTSTLMTIGIPVLKTTIWIGTLNGFVAMNWRGQGTPTGRFPALMDTNPQRFCPRQLPVDSVVSESGQSRGNQSLVWSRSPYRFQHPVFQLFFCIGVCGLSQSNRGHRCVVCSENKFFFEMFRSRNLERCRRKYHPRSHRGPHVAGRHLGHE